uniref:RabBD domain-containing protein n=1 Tax=Heterorhabditis bacteriophora TaxID=37862 RepID=A0A1I7X8S1_HETBA
MLKELTAEEQAIIRPVLERDLEFQRREKARVRLLKTSVNLYKSESIAHQSSTYSMPESESSESMTSYQSNISSAR